MLEVNEGNAAEVRRLFDLGLKDAPKNRFIWLAWGVFEQAQDNLERARYLLSTGSKLNPRDPALLQAWARLEAGSGDTAKARRLFKRGLKVDASHQPLWQVGRRQISLDPAPISKWLILMSIRRLRPPIADLCIPPARMARLESLVDAKTSRLDMNPKVLLATNLWSSERVIS